MRKTTLYASIFGATLLSVGSVTAQAGYFYDPSNVASPTGETIGFELDLRIGCPGRNFSDKPCVPEDSDGDGVFDYKDKCPGTPAGRKVDAKGCELDTDGDGLVDGVDACPTVYAKTADGCPLPVAAAPKPAPAPEPAPAPAPAAEPAKLVLDGVNFDFDQAALDANDRAILDRDAAAFLDSHRDVVVEVAGHTDSMGPARYNMGLSQRRADAVRDYLIGKGVPAERLVAKGYGEAQPVADNKTKAGRAKNRRVELVPAK